MPKLEELYRPSLWIMQDTGEIFEKSINTARITSITKILHAVM